MYITIHITYFISSICYKYETKDKLYTKENWFLEFQDVIEVFGNCIDTIIYVFEKTLGKNLNIDPYAHSISLKLKILN